MKKVVLSALLVAAATVAFGAQGKQMTHDELVKAAKAEGKVVVYSITSRIANAATNFEKAYGIKVEASNLKDGELIEKVTREVGGGIPGADFVICQDSGRVFGQLIATGYLVNYVPDSMKSVIPVAYQNPWYSSTSTRSSSSTTRRPRAR